MEEQKKIDISGRKEEEVMSQPEEKKKVSIIELLLEALKSREENRRQSLVEAMT